MYFFNPENSIWFPKCPFYVLTGYQCPACGIQRAVHHLVHFDFIEAFRYNPFLVVSIPYALSLILVKWIVPQSRLVALRATCYHPLTVRIYIALMLIWWIGRNIVHI